MKSWQPIYTNLKQKPRDAISTVTLLPSTSLLKAFGMHTTPQQRSTKRTPQTLLEVIKLVKKFNAAQQVMATLTSSAVNMMSNDDWCFVCGKTGHIGHHCPDVQCYNCEEFSHFAQDCPNKIPPSWTPPHHNRSCSQTHCDHNHRDRSVPYLDIAMEDALTAHDHTTDPTTTESLATTKDTHPNPHPTTAAVCAFLWLTIALGNTHARTHHTGINMNHLDNTPFPTSHFWGYSTDQSQSSPSPSHHTLADLTQRKWQNCIPKAATPHKSHCQKKVIITLPQNQTMIQIH